MVGFLKHPKSGVKRYAQDEISRKSCRYCECMNKIWALKVLIAGGRYSG